MKRIYLSAQIILFIISIAETINAQWTHSIEREGINCFYAEGSKIYAGSDSSNYFYSPDGGKEWIKNTLPKIFERPSTHKEWKLTIGSIIYHFSKLYLGTEMGLLHSKDNGESWTLVKDSQLKAISAFAAYRGNLIFSVSEYDYRGLYKFNYEGTGWTKIESDLPLMEIQTLVAQDTDLLASGESEDGKIFRSTNFGDTWQKFDSGIHWYHNIRSLAFSGNNVIAGTDKGIYFAENTSSAVWKNKNIGLPKGYNGTDPTEVYSIAVYYGNIYIGTRSGVYLSTDNGEKWFSIGLDDQSIHCLIVVNSVLFAGSWDNGLWKLDLSNVQIKPEEPKTPPVRRR